MRVVQTFWSGNKDIAPFVHQGGWASPEYHWMSWALSSQLLRRHYDELELYTDQLGKKILIDELKLPYTKVHILFDNSFNIHPSLFALAKIKTFSAQQMPFTHVDSDLFIWKPFPPWFERADVLSSNIELNLFFNKEILQEVSTHFRGIPDHLESVHLDEDIFSSNAGVIGGNDLAFFKEYCKCAFDFIGKNEDYLQQVKTNDLNFLIEQISLFYLAKKNGVEITYLMKDPVDHPLYQDYLRFADAPEVEMVHAVGACKRNPFVLNHLAQRLRLEFPDSYYTILEKCKSAGLALQNSLYDHLRVGGKQVLGGLVDEVGFRSRLALPLQSRNTLFANAFQRSLAVAQAETETPIESRAALDNYVASKEASLQIKELHKLEELVLQKLLDMLSEIQKGKLYGTYYAQYQQTADSFFLPDLLSRTIVIHPDAEVIHLGWYWKYEKGEVPLEKVVGKQLKRPHEEIVATISYNPITLLVEENYHDALDAIILHGLSSEKLVLELLKEVATHFEDDIDPYNPDFQLLLFDSLKRLSFANIIKIRSV